MRFPAIGGSKAMISQLDPDITEGNLDIEVVSRNPTRKMKVVVTGASGDADLAFEIRMH
jgi:hypothetical protein